MTQIVTQTAQKTKEQLVAEILYLATATHYHTERCVFVQFSGHVNQLSISIRKNKPEYQEEIAKNEIYLVPNRELSAEALAEFEQNLLTQLTDTKVSLETFIKDGFVDERNLKEIVTYSF